MNMAQVMELDIFLMYMKDPTLFQKIIKLNLKLEMVVSNEPGYYRKK